MLPDFFFKKGLKKGQHYFVVLFSTKTVRFSAKNYNFPLNFLQHSRIEFLKKLGILASI
jgi:hypothetical protein